MTLLPHFARLKTNLQPELRLELLQQHDPLREWNSVDEVRVCMACSRKISGRVIRILSHDKRLWFCCPTRGCAGTLQDFAKSGDPLLDEDVWDDWCRTLTIAANSDESGRSLRSMGSSAEEPVSPVRIQTPAS